MRIIQIIPRVSYGDGVSNCLVNLISFFCRNGIENILFCGGVDKRIKRIVWQPLEKLEDFQFSDDEVVLYHFYGATPLNMFVERLACKKVLVFQNVAYAKYFREHAYDSYQRLLAGVNDANLTAGRYLKAIVLSDFSKRNLVEFGWRRKAVSIFPLYRITEKGQADARILQKYDDNRKNIIFTGRISPNKKIEDIIRIYAHYKQHYDKDARLFLVGSFPFPNYKTALDDYIRENGIRDVIFTDHVSEEELEAYYKVADLFLCMSEHEGFGIPILEAMSRGIPVVAYAATAVPYTMGGAGILVRTKDEASVSRKMARVLCDSSYREKIIAGQLKRVRRENLESQKDRFLKFLRDVEGIKEWHYKESQSLIGEFNGLTDPVDVTYLKQFPSVVLYGLGKVGSNVLRNMRLEGQIPVAVCDNSVTIPDDGAPEVLRHAECVEKYPGAHYVVTVQRGCMKIIRDLVRDGIPVENITVFNNAQKRWEGCVCVRSRPTH